MWLFPAKDAPITTNNIESSIAATRQASEASGSSRAGYFASVPYILQMLADEKNGEELLQQMDIVSVGGAPLAQSIGDRMVSQNIQLVSRFGSSECGFLLSSHRDYEVDREWQYLRLRKATQNLRFDPQNDGSGLSELIVEKGWPQIVKVNRDCGGYATSDLFEPHPSIASAWRYHSRNDSQITLTTGKKFDPEPLEALIAAQSKTVRDAVVFGSGRDAPGVLIFPSQNISDAERMEAEIRQFIKLVNTQGQHHTQIAEDKIVFMPIHTPPLRRSSKGTLMRGITEKEFEDVIAKVYEQDGKSPIRTTFVAKSAFDVLLRVRETVHRALDNDQLRDDADFFAHGVDSIAAAKVRQALQEASFQCPTHHAQTLLTTPRSFALMNHCSLLILSMIAEISISELEIKIKLAALIMMIVLRVISIRPRDYLMP